MHFLLIFFCGHLMPKSSLLLVCGQWLYCLSANLYNFIIGSFFYWKYYYIVSHIKQSTHKFCLIVIESMDSEWYLYCGSFSVDIISFKIWNAIESYYKMFSECNNERIQVLDGTSHFVTNQQTLEMYKTVTILYCRHRLAGKLQIDIRSSSKIYQVYVH